jgi:carboxymethylenebutenolidase
MTSGSEITIATGAGAGGQFKGYLALPPGGRGPGLLVFHAIFGVNQVVRDYADDFARQGYVALCPDMFWRQEPGVCLSEQRPEDMAHGMALFNRYDMDAGVADLRSALAALRALDACTGPAGCVGYCFGGRMAYMMAAHTDIDAAVGYYGTAIEQHLDVAGRVSRPLMLHQAGNDHFVPPEAQEAIRKALEGNPDVTIHTYPGIGHAFARVGAPNYDAVSAELADRRTADFLARHVTGARNQIV